MNKMNRQYLKNGIEIKLGNDTFKIVNFVGGGANCVVYEVIKKKNDYEYKYYLKECYPFNADISRNDDGSLIWLNEGEKEKSLANFKNAYSTLLKIYNNEYFTNSTSIPVEIYEANDTIYILNDIKIGSTFKDDNTENLSDILATIIALSKLIGKYHEEGYLHLDIKPENMFLLEETRELVVLFDVDSVVAIDLLKKGEVESISYSENYAAPEQRDGNFSEINERTDICSVGATLFYKIMGRYVRALDRGIFADWNFDNNSFFRNINPQTRKHIKDIFHKTLAVQNKNRYENTSELIKALEEAKKVCDEEIYLKSDYPAVIKNFVGRDNELNEIKSAFENKNNIVFLHGFGGIGKSELSKKYAQDYSNYYDVILFCKYNISLKDTLMMIPIGNECGDKQSISFQDKEIVLKRLLDEKALLIIDNFDVDVAEDGYLCELSRYKANIIITTRTDFESCKIEGFKQINISTIDKETLKGLFVAESGLENITPEEDVYIDEILAAYKYHTLFVKPLAYKIKPLGYTIKALKEEVDAELLEDIDLIVGVQNDKLYEETLMSLAEKLFKISKLDETKQKILSDLYLLGDVKVDTYNYIEEIYKDASNVSKRQIRNSVIELIRSGIIQKGELRETLEIHPIVAEIIKSTLSPDINPGNEVLKFIHNKVIRKTKNPRYFYFGEDIFSIKTLSTVILKLDISNQKNVDYIIDLMYDVCSMGYHIEMYTYLYKDTVKKIPEDNNNTKLIYLKFVTMFNNVNLFKKVRRNIYEQKELEKDVVEYIYNYYTTQNDKSFKFRSLFWKMVIMYKKNMKEFKCWGWNVHLYSMLKECVNYKESNETISCDCVCRKTGISNAYIIEDEKWEEDKLISIFEKITERYLESQKLIERLNVVSDNKSSFDVYNECMNLLVEEYEKELSPFFDKYKDLSVMDKLEVPKSVTNKIKQISEDIYYEPLMGEEYREYLKGKYSELFILCERRLLYQSMIDNMGFDRKILFEKIFCDKKLSEDDKCKLLCKMLQKVTEGYNDPKGYDAQSEVVSYISEHIEEIMDMDKDFGFVRFIGLVLYAYYVVDYEKFEEIIDAVIESAVDNIICKLDEFMRYVQFDFLVDIIKKVQMCHRFYPFICKYFDEIYAVKERNFEETYLLLKSYRICAEEAYRETGKEEYKIAYRRYKELLDKERQ